MIVSNDYHPVHYEVIEAEKRTGMSLSLNKGTKHKIYLFPNGYGASVVQGFVSQNQPELAVLKFDRPVPTIRSKKKRLRKKRMKQSGKGEMLYENPIASPIARYSSQRRLDKALHHITKFKPYEY